MNKLIFVFILILYSFMFLSADPVSAESYMDSGSAVIKTDSDSAESLDHRIFRLKGYLETHNSPLADHAKDFVNYADKYELDWRFVAAISGVESTFGKRIPINSFNAYGWANGDYYFESWEDSIEHVSRILKEKYVDDGLTSVNQIARRYAPPSSSWAWKVKFFMDEIDPIPLEFTI